MKRDTGVCLDYIHLNVQPCMGRILYLTYLYLLFIINPRGLATRIKNVYIIIKEWSTIEPTKNLPKKVGS